MLYKLLKHKISTKQLLGFTIANLIGLSIVFIGIQAYSDIYTILTSKDSFLQDEYIVLTKKVNTIGSLLGSTPSFSDKEISKIKKQPFIQDVGLFTASQFKTQATIKLVGQQFGLSTEMFFESVPDQFVDVESADWRYEPESKQIPIIIPRSYLDLYNFGFAAGKRLPKISEGLIHSINLSIQLSGKQKKETFQGRIIGFSKRLNTILVPEDFLIQANQTFSSHTATEPLRLIIKTKNSSDPQLAQFIEQQNYLIDGNQLDTGQARYFLNLSISIVLFIGLLISLLACYILILSIYLVVEKSSYSLENLALLGYSSKQIAKPYLIIASSLTLLSSGLGLAISYMVQRIYLPLIQNISSETLQTGLSSLTYLAAGLILLTIITISYFVITRKIKQISYFK